MKKQFLGYFLLLFFNLASCYKGKEGKKNLILKADAEEAINAEPVVISEISIEKSKDQKKTTGLNQYSDYLIKFKAASLSVDPVYIVTFKDSSCLYIGDIDWKRGRKHSRWSYESRYSNEFHKKLYLSSSPIQLYYPLKFDPNVDSVFYFFQYNQVMDLSSTDKNIYFKVTPSEVGPQIKLWKKNN